MVKPTLERLGGACLLASALLASSSCRARPSKESDAGALHPIDKMYLTYKESRSWVDPADPTKTYSPEPLEAYCAHCDYMCRSNMRPIAERIPIETDADLVPLVRWLGDDDNCVRAAAVDALWPLIGFQSGGRSVTVEDRDDIGHHKLVCALRARLDVHQIRYDPHQFDPFMVSSTEKDFGKVFEGRWEQPVSNEGWQTIVVVAGETIELIRRPRTDAGATDDVNSYEIAELRRNEKYQYVIDGAWRRDPAEARDGGKRQRPRNGRKLVFWPSARDSAWFSYSNEGSETLTGWTKLKRKR